MADRLQTQWAPRILSITRIIAALIFMEHGTSKLLGFPVGPFTPEAMTLPWIAGILEIVGGALLLVGLFTRPVAFVLSGLMAFAYWLVHAPQSAFPLLNGGDAAILFCFLFLYIAFAGGGPWSVDAIFRGKK